MSVGQQKQDSSQAVEVGAHRQLSPAHLQELAASGISKEFAQKAGLYTEYDSAKLARLANRKRWSSKWGSALAFPYIDFEGQLTLTRLKPERPPTRGGKPLKYLQPAGVKTAAYFPPGFTDHVGAGKSRMLITEGEKKALCLAERGLPVIGLAGVWNWKPKGKVSKLLPEIDRFKWHDCRVFIVFDSDCVSKENVLAAEQALAATLESRGAEVRCVRLPDAKDGSKQGVDDFIVAQGESWKPAFHRLLNAAVEPDAVDPGSVKQSVDDLDPATEATAIVTAMTKDGVSKLRYWHGTWWMWRQGCYSTRRDDEVKAELINNLNKKYMGLRPRHANDVLEHIKAKTILSSKTEAPAWIAGNGDDPPPSECVVLKNGLLHLPTMYTDNAKCLTPATPRLLTTAAVDYQFDRNAPEPRTWKAFLGSVWSECPESIATLQELFGYLLTADTRQQKIFLLIGPTRSGKGVISRVLRNLVGATNVCGPTLTGLAGNFGLQSLLGKSVAIVSDARLGYRTDQSVVLERLLSISGEDALSVPVKFKEDVTTKLPTRLVILSNELPRLLDASSAIIGRFVVLRMANSFLGREDRDLDAKLAQELPGIFLWACEGWRRLNERGYFQQPDSGIELLGELQDLSSPVAAFVRDRCEVGPGCSVKVSELFGDWSSWCRSNGRDHTGTVQAFGRDLLAAVPSVVRKRRGAGGKDRVYEGIRVRSSRE